MIATVGVVLALASQRGGASAEEKRPVGPLELRGRGRTVTANTLRMSDPGFVARTLRGADTPEGLSFARSVLPPEMIARRGEYLAAYAPYLRRIERAKPIRIGEGPTGRPAPIDPNAPKDDGPPPPPSGGTIRIVYRDISAPFDLGTSVAESSKGAITFATYRGIAPKNGTLSVQDKFGTAIDASRLIVYTGEVKNGVPQTVATAIGDQAGKSLPVKEGQEFAVRVFMRRDKIGSYSEPIVVNDGSRKITLNATGKVVPKTGAITCWFEDGEAYALAGNSATLNLHIKVAGNAPTDLELSGTVPLKGVTVPAQKSKAKAQDELIVPVTLYANPAAPDATGPLTVTVRGYGGSVVAEAKTNAKVETLWTEWKDFTGTAGNVTVVGTFRYSTAGLWDLSLYAKTTSKSVNDFIFCGLYVDKPIEGHRLGTGAWEGLYAAKNGVPNKSISKSGYEPLLAGAAFLDAPIIGTLIVDGTGTAKPLKAPVDYWKDSNKLVWLSEFE